MKTALTITLIVCLVSSAVPLSARESIGAMIAEPGRPETMTMNLLATHSMSPAENMETRFPSNGLIAADVRWVRDVRADLEAFQRDGAVIGVELKASRLTGSDGVLRHDQFELIQQSPNRDMLPYDQVAAFRDPATGQLLAAVQKRGIGGVGRPSVKTTLIVMGAIAGALILFWYVAIPK